jgi:formiminoglutamase
LKNLKIYTKEYIDSLTVKRDGESKLGENVQALEKDANADLEYQLMQSSANYVLLGLPEDIGIKANKGRGGAYSAWQPTISSFLNIQSNIFLSGKEILVLGHIDFSDLLEKASHINFKKPEGIIQGNLLVNEIDNRVYPIIQAIIKSGKEAVIIGGGHNNAYPNIKGAALGLFDSKKIDKPAINSINLDAHSDFRALEGRHSGNGFSYAFHDGFLNKYGIIGLHENYNSDKVLEVLAKNKKRINYSLYEDIFVRESLTFKQAIDQALKFCKDNYIGLEIDLDSVQNIPSSAKTSSGISANQARFYINHMAENIDIAYLHIPEGAPVLSHIKTDNKTGKLIAYLISDFIKARNKFKKIKKSKS